MAFEKTPWRVALGVEGREAYLTSTLRHYALYRWTAAHVLPPPRAILGIGYTEAPLLYSPSPIYRAEISPWGRALLAAGDPAEALARLREYGFDYVVLDLVPDAPRAADWRERYVVSSRAFTDSALRLVHAENDLALYTVPRP